MRQLAAAFLFLALCAGPALGQGYHQPRWLIDAPTAGLLPHKTGGLDVRFYDGNGIVVGTELGLWDRMALGVSFGGQQLLGRQRADWNPYPGVSVRVRVMEETHGRPAIALGFNSQGYGAYIDSTSRYVTKSLGAYAAFSRNYRITAGEVGMHFGLNRSFEDEDDGSLSAWVGLDMDLGKRLAFLGEYHLGMNDNASRALGSGRGYLNAAVRWSVSGRFAIELDLKNVLENGSAVNPDREVRIIYVLE